MATDNTIIPIFFLDAVELTFRSEQEGRPIFEDREFVRLLIAGDNKTEHVREVRREDIERWPEQYKRFKANMDEREQMKGTPLSAWPIMKPSDIRMWNSINVFTVEQIAELSDTSIQNFGMGGRETQVKAKAFLADAKDSAEATRLAAENERLRADISDLQAQVRELAARAKAEDDKKRSKAA